MAAGRLGPPGLRAIRALCAVLPGRAGAALGFHASRGLAGRGGLLEGRVPTGASIQLMAQDAVHRHIYLHAMYEPATTALLRATLQPGWTVLDVGANAGYFSLLAADLVGPGGRVYAFEPNPELFALLHRSALLHPAANLVAVQAALGEEQAEVSLYVPADAANTGLSTVRKDVAGGGALTVPVKMLRLDDFCAGHSLHPRLIKIDVEGHELPVLAGALRTLRSVQPDYVVCELETSRCPAGPLLAYMDGLGYRACSLTPLGILTPYEDRPVQNVVFVAGGAAGRPVP